MVEKVLFKIVSFRYGPGITGKTWLKSSYNERFEELQLLGERGRIENYCFKMIRCSGVVDR